MSLVETLREDEQYAEFFDEEFDPSRYANNIIQGSTIAASLHKLSSGIKRLEQELHSQVISHHADLLTQATGIEKLEGVLKMVTSRVEALSKSTERIRDKIEKPYEKIVTRNAQLFRLQEACEVLRGTLRYLYLARRLKEQLRGGTREIAKAAQTLSEMNALSSDVDLTGVDVVDAEANVVYQAGEGIEKKASEMLTHGIDTHSQTQIATALQVFRNLGTLKEVVDQRIDARHNALDEAISSCLDMSGFVKPEHSVLSAYRAELWTKMEHLMNKLQAVCVQVRQIERVLMKKKDTVTHKLFSDLVSEDGESISYVFMMRVFEMLKEKLNDAASRNTLQKKCFDEDYPKLLRMFNDLWARIQQQAGQDVPQDVAAEEQQKLRECLSTFEQSYLSGSLSRMFDPICLVFPQGGNAPPSSDEVHNICKTIARELEVSRMDYNLLGAVSKNVTKTIKLYSVKSEETLATGTRAIDVSSSKVPEALKRNISLINRIHQFRTGIQGVLKTGATRLQYSESIIDPIRESLQHPTKFIDEVLTDLFEAIKKAILQTIHRIHSVKYSDNQTHHSMLDEPEAPCSEYVLALQEQIVHIESQVLARFSDKELVSQRTKELMNFALEQFIIHAVLITGLGEAGKLRLAGDMAQVELALAPLQNISGSKVSDLGKAYKSLRQFRPLLFMDANQVADSPATGATLPKSIIILHLFSRAPKSIQRPHVLKGWSQQSYATQLSQQTEEERMEVIVWALNVYADTVKARGERQFDPIYPVMLKLAT